MRDLILDYPEAVPENAECSEQLPAALVNIGVDRAWTIATGRTVKTAILGTGIADHPDFADRIVGRRNFSEDSDLPLDPHGQGTADAGVIAGAQNGHGIVGIAPASSLVDVRVLGASGATSFERVIEALKWCVAEHRPDLIYLPFGANQPPERFVEAVRHCAESGALVLARARAFGDESAVYQYAMPVRSVGSGGASPSDEVIAPGGFWDVALPNGQCARGVVRGAAVACGVAALAKEVTVGSPETIRTLLKRTGTPLEGESIPLINAYRAVGGSALDPDRSTIAIHSERVVSVKLEPTSSEPYYLFDNEHFAYISVEFSNWQQPEVPGNGGSIRWQREITYIPNQRRWFHTVRVFNDTDKPQRLVLRIRT